MGQHAVSGPVLLPVGPLAEKGVQYVMGQHAVSVHILPTIGPPADQGA